MTTEEEMKMLTQQEMERLGAIPRWSTETSFEQPPQAREFRFVMTSARVHTCEAYDCIVGDSYIKLFDSDGEIIHLIPLRNVEIAYFGGVAR